VDVIKFFVNDTVHFFIQVDQFAGAVELVLGLKERGNHGPHSFVVLAEEGLEYCKVKLAHLVNHFIENIRVLSLSWVLIDVKNWRRKGFDHQLVSIQDFLGKNIQKLVNFLVVDKP
jgi:hypothetical protein